MVAGLVGTDTVTTQDPHGLYDTTNEEWGLLLATTGDRYLATSGYFFMATDRRSNLARRRLVIRRRSDPADYCAVVDEGRLDAPLAGEAGNCHR